MKIKLILDNQCSSHFVTYHLLGQRQKAKCTVILFFENASTIIKKSNYRPA